MVTTHTARSSNTALDANKPFSYSSLGEGTYNKSTQFITIAPRTVYLEKWSWQN